MLKHVHVEVFVFGHLEEAIALNTGVRFVFSREQSRRITEDKRNVFQGGTAFEKVKVDWGQVELSLSLKMIDHLLHGDGDVFINGNNAGG